RRIQAARRNLMADTRALNHARQELSVQQAQTDSRTEQLQREKAILEEQHQIVTERQQELQKKLAGALADLETREHKLAEGQAGLALGQKQYDSDLAKLERFQGRMEKRRKSLEQRALEVDHRFEQLQRRSREQQEQSALLEASQQKLTSDQAELDMSKAEHA